MTKSTGYTDLTGTGFPRRLKRLRNQRHWSKTDLAEEAGLSERTVRELEAGRRDQAQEKTLLLLAKALEVTLDDLLGRNETADEASTPRRTLWVSAAAAFLVVLALAGAFVWQGARAKAVWEADGGELIVRDGLFGIEMWRLQANCRVVLCQAAPWSDRELIVGFSGCDDRRGSVLCVERTSGRTLWETEPDVDAIVAAFGPEIVLGGKMKYRKAQPADLDGDGSPELIVEFIHTSYYPHAICRLDRDGHLLNQYANRGHLFATVVTDIDGDDRDEILAAGVSNAVVFQGPTFILLDDTHFAGAAVDSLSGLRDGVSDSSLVRVVMPRFPGPVQAMMDGPRLAAFTLEVYTNPEGEPEISARVGSSPRSNDHLIVVLDHELRPVKAVVRDSFLRTITTTWPEALRGTGGPEDPGWRDAWLARAVRFEVGRQVAPDRPPGSG